MAIDDPEAVRPRHRIPLWLKVGWTAWVLAWTPVYWRHYGPANFLWFCDLGNFALGAALWLESPLLFSWQAVSLLVVQTHWTIDVAGRLALGFHPLGGSEYMFDATIPLGLRLLSLFHAATPPLLVWALCRLGYDCSSAESVVSIRPNCRIGVAVAAGPQVAPVLCRQTFPDHRSRRDAASRGRTIILR